MRANRSEYYANRDLARIRASVTRGDANSLSAVSLLYIAKRRKDKARERRARLLTIGAVVCVMASLFIGCTN